MTRKENSNNPELEIVGRFNQYTEKVIESWLQLETKQGNRYVSIDRNRLKEIALLHYQDNLEVPAWRFKGVYPQDDLAFVSSCLSHNTINAAFNLPNGEKYSVPFGEGKPFSGAYAMVRKFYEAFGEELITTIQLREAFKSPESTKKFFSGLNEIPYPDLRYLQLQDFIENLQLNNQNPIDLLFEISELNEEGEIIGFRAFDSQSGQGLVDLLIRQFPLAYGADHQTTGGLVFPMFKRAQLVALEMHGRAVNSTEETYIKPFIDIDQIGPIADYEVPRSLRGLGIITVSNSLSKKIQSWKEVVKDSKQEVELRAATIVSCAGLLIEINKLRQADQLPLINMSHLDYWLWSQAKIVAGNIKPNLTRTMAY